MEAIKRRQKPFNLMAQMPEISSRTVLVWEENPKKQSYTLSHFYTTLEQWPLFDGVRIEEECIMIWKDDETRMRTPFQFKSYSMAQKLELAMSMMDVSLHSSMAMVHVLYEPLSLTRAKGFRLYHQIGEGWEEHRYPAPDYDYEGFDFEYFVMRSEKGSVHELSSLMNTNGEIAMSLGQMFINSL